MITFNLSYQYTQIIFSNLYMMMSSAKFFKIYYYFSFSFSQTITPGVFLITFIPLKFCSYDDHRSKHGETNLLWVSF